MQYSPKHPLDVQQVQTLLHNCPFSFSCHYAPFPLAFPLFLILQRASLLFKHLCCRRGAGKWAREWAMIRKGWKSGFIYKERGRSIPQHCPYVSFFKLEWVAGRQKMNSCSPLEDNKYVLTCKKGSTYCFLRAPVHSAEVASSHRRGGARRVRQSVSPSHWAGQSGSEGSVAAHYRQNKKRKGLHINISNHKYVDLFMPFEGLANYKSTFSERQH